MNLENIKLDFEFDIDQVIEDAKDLKIDIIDSDNPCIKYNENGLTSTFKINELFNYETNNRPTFYEGNIKVSEITSFLNNYKINILKKNNSRDGIRNRTQVRDKNTNHIRSITRQNDSKYLVGVN
ncbi:hypothetical protein MTW84_08120 [Mammaliicoccus sciuri]|uniref:hypothetical protein n=1 Tax=Mammaliicoccus sciuri TaxID=1296 RepID=UPI001FB4E5A9|nr:hypothetical protein [Mammaliicoccus sciuri]MCJ0909156.1 hypothetical protein [Mammaliicoccus sciuri]